MKINYFKKMAVLAVILVMSVPAVSSAQYYPPQSQAAQIAYLYSVLAQLQAQLTALQAAQGGSYNPYYPYNPYTPISTSDRVEATTEGVRVRNGEVVLEGRVDFDVRDSARAWFEYGTDRDVKQSTQSVKVSGNANSSKSVAIPASVIRAHTSYYYRLVAEDSRGDYSEGVLRSFTVNRYDNDYDDDDDDDDEDYPDVTTDDARNVSYDRAELRGEVDMNDYRNGLVFFVYGEDEDQVEDAEDEDEYQDIDTDGDDLRKVIVDSDLDDDDDFRVVVRNLNDDTEYYFRLCVEFEDEDDDERLICGDVEEFETDRR